MHRALVLLPLVLLLPGPVLAQATGFSTLSFTGVTGTTTQVNLADCEAGETLGVSWATDAALASGQQVVVSTSTKQECAEANRIRLLSTIDTGSSGTAEIPVVDAVVDACDPTAADVTVYVCFQLSGGTLTTAQTNTLIIEVDTNPPIPPSTLTAVGGDRSIRLTWSYADVTKPADLAAFRAAYRSADATGDPSYTNPTVEGATELRVSGLTNGIEYEVWVEARDDAGNWGEGSPSATATPEESNDFWESYLAAGGSAEQGCSSGRGGGALGGGLLLLAGALLLLRRRRPRALAALLVLAAFLPGTAHAQSWVDPDRAWFFELHLGAYGPEVDSEFGGSGPYNEIFGNESDLEAGFRLERALWQGFGQVSVGLGASFAQAVGKALTPSGERSPDTTVFNWIPVELTATYRFDWLAEELHIPFAFFGRVGLVWQPWWILDGTGSVAKGPGGEVGQGARWGYRYGGGAMLLLDFLDPRLAKDFERSSGVDNSYLYVELMRRQVDSFGAAGFDLSDSTWAAGLMLEF